ncbi:MAG: PD-(D/E)XK nuclease family protein [Bacteroidales bacterium]|nr:PD-(D/E)XK nuclease family protein [Bacteroidales bacterium]
MSHDTFLSKLAKHLQSHYDLSHQELTLVFPNKRAAFYLRDELKKNNQQTIWMPEMLSIQEAFTQWSGIALADSLDLLFELIDINAELHVEQNSDLNVFSSKATQMAKDFDDIDQYNIDAKFVFSYVFDNKKLEIWNFDEEKSKEKERKYLDLFQRLHDYYLRLRDRLSKQGKGYYGMITKHLAELPEAELLERVGDRKIVFAGFNALTTTEERIVDTLVKNGKADILFDYDAYYLDDPNNEAGLFGRRYQSKHPNWLKNGISNRLQTEEKHIHIISASGNALQAKALQAKLQESPDKEQAVILPDQNLLIPVLNSIPETYSGFNVSMGYPLAKTPVNQLVKEYFALCRRKRISRKITENETERLAEGWYIWSVLHLMDLEIVKIIFPKNEQEAFSRWKYDAVPNGKFIFEDRDIEGLQQMPNIQAFLKIFLPHSDDRSPQAILDNISQVLAFVAQMIQAKGDTNENTFLLNQVSEIGKIISRLQNIVECNTKYINDLQSTETLYRVLASGASLRLNSSATEGLQIMGLLETRCLDFERLHLLSANEGILPPDKSQGSFIPQFIRRACGLPGYAESQAVVAYHFYHLLQSGKEIYLYYNDLGETFGGEASRFILQIKHELTQNANIVITEEAFSSVAEPSLDVKALCAQKSEETLTRLHYLTQEKGLSPSALSTYLNCPLKYFLHYIADIKDNSVEEDTGSNVIGTIIHDTLEFLFADYLPVDDKLQVIDKKLFDEKIKPLWEQKLAQSIAKNTPNGFPDVGFNYLNHVTIEQQLKNYLNYTSEQLKNSTLTILKTEEDLKANLSTDHSNFVFGGRADRIDQFDGITRVIDYKTGHVDNSDLKVPVRHRSESALEYLRQIPDKALQLLLYKYMYLKGNTTLSPDQVAGAIHGLKYANNIEFGLYRANIKKDDTDADANFLGDDTFIKDMESMLAAVVAEMLEPEIPFVQAEDDKKCSYCEFKLICKR